VEHINAITTMAREQTTLTPETAARYLQACEIALQRCQQRLEHLIFPGYRGHDFPICHYPIHG
ncbi:hypothetical protein, partial [Cronobacter malonaticus]|uniref:hypothetical protein n=1 Tax=Cronobacter malonaticus TaxID=413503 RepID=UPI00131A2E39